MRTLIASLLLVGGVAFADKPTHAKPTDINTASSAELKELPGVTDDIAAKIVAGRPYSDKAQLLQQNMVDKVEYAKLRPLIVAKQPKAIGGQGSVEKHEGPGPATDSNVKK
jgi:hypothetical protein